MNINIRGDVKSARRFLNKMQRRQIPFATSLALNSSAVKIQRFEKAKIRTDLDNPTPQVQKAIRVKRSNKHDLEAAVFILPAVARFLRWQIDGGTRPPRGRIEAVPVNTRLNKYGNVPGRRQGKLGKLLSKPDIFTATIGGVAGIWQRGRGRLRNQNLKLLFAFESSTRYQARFRFFHYAQQTLNRVWVREFRRAYARALK